MNRASTAGESNEVALGFHPPRGALVASRATRVDSMPRQIALPTEQASEHFAQALAAALTPGDLVILEGDLGAGKTFIAQHVVWALGVPAATPVTSPTFTLVNQYQGRDAPILHADLYRLGEPDELVELGLMDRIGRDAVALVEWGDRFAEALGADALWVWLSLHDAGRVAKLGARGPRGEALLCRLDASL